MAFPVFITVNVWEMVEPGTTLPKSVPSVVLGVESPSTIDAPLPKTSISGFPVTTAFRAKLYGDSSLSLLVIETWPLNVVAVVDEKFTENVSDAPGPRLVTSVLLPSVKPPVIDGVPR